MISSICTSTASTPTSACRPRPGSTIGSTRKSYVRPWLGKKRVRDLTPETIVAWQRKLMAEGGVKDGEGVVREHGASGSLAVGGCAQARGRAGRDPLEPVASVSSGRPPGGQCHGTGHPIRHASSSGTRRATGCIRSGRSCSARDYASANWSGSDGAMSTCSAGTLASSTSPRHSGGTSWNLTARARRRFAPLISTLVWSPCWSSSVRCNASNPAARDTRPPTTRSPSLPAATTTLRSSRRCSRACL